MEGRGFLTPLKHFLFLFVILLLLCASLFLAMRKSPATVESPEPQEPAVQIQNTTEVQDTPQVVDTGPDLSMYPEALQVLYENNPDARDYVMAYFEKKDLSYTIDLSEYAGCSSVPLLMQWDERWGYQQYAGNLMGLSGCGPTVMSMASIYLTGETTWDPLSVARYSDENGYSVSGNGTKWTLFTDGSEAFGVASKELPLSESTIRRHLENGELVACIMGPGVFTTSGHYILLTGVTDEGFTVCDSNSYANSAKVWAYDEFSDQIRNLWALTAA